MSIKLTTRHGRWRFMTRPQIRALLQKLEKDSLLQEMMKDEKVLMEEVLQVYEEGILKFNEISKEYPGLYIELTGGSDNGGRKYPSGRRVAVTVQDMEANDWSFDSERQTSTGYKQALKKIFLSGKITEDEYHQILEDNGFTPLLKGPKAALAMVVKGKGSIKATLGKLKSANTKKKPKSKKKAR